MGMLLYKEMTANDTIILSSSIGTFLTWLENVVEFLALLFSFRNVTYILVKFVQQDRLKNSIEQLKVRF